MIRLKVRDHLVAFGEEVAADENARAVRGRRLDDDHRRAAPGPFPVIAEVPVPGQALMAHVDRMGAENHTARKLAVAKLDGGKEVRELLAHDGRPRLGRLDWARPP